jgi:hypothetical protein
LVIDFAVGRRRGVVSGSDVVKRNKKQATSGGIVCFVVSFFSLDDLQKIRDKRSCSLRCEIPASCSGVLQEETRWELIGQSKQKVSRYTVNGNHKPRGEKSV